MDCSPPGSSIHGFSRQEYWSGLPSLPPEDRPTPGIEPTSLTSPILTGRFFATRATWEAPALGLVSLLDCLNRTQETSLLTRPVVSSLLAPRTILWKTDFPQTWQAGRGFEMTHDYYIYYLFPI